MFPKVISLQQSRSRPVQQSLSACGEIDAYNKSKHFSSIYSRIYAFEAMVARIWTQVLSMFALFLIIRPIFATAQQLVDPVSKDNSPNCDCFVVSGPDPSYFQHHRFWDFQNIADGANGEDYTVAPPLVTAAEDAGLEPVTSNFLNSTKWGLDWEIQNWVSNATKDSPVVSVNSAQNIFISRNTSSADSSTYLTLRASRLPDFMSISEFDSLQNNILHSSIRARMRVIPNGLSTAAAPSTRDADVRTDAVSTTDPPVDVGAVAGLFTYYSATEESDIEILTRDPIDRIRYSNQPDFNYQTGDTVPGASTDLAVPNTFDWTNWLEHRIDWHDGISRWYINNQLMLSKTMNVPDHPSGLIVNLWSDGGEWSGNMTVGVQVQLAIQWIDMVFNVSGPLSATNEIKRDVRSVLSRKTSTTCHVGCTIDGVAQVGFPEQVFNSTNSNDAISTRNGRFGVGVYSAVAMGALGTLCIWGL